MKKTRNQIKADVANTVTEYYEDCFNRILKREVPDAARRERAKKFFRDFVKMAGFDLILKDAVDQVIEILEACDINAPFEVYAKKAASITEEAADFAVKLAINGERFPETFIAKMKEGM